MKLVRNSIIIVSLGLVISLCVLVYLSTNKSHYQYLNFSSNVPVGENYLGIDVSHYQGLINWDEVDSVQHNKDSISFVFIKATEGIDLIDPMLSKNGEDVQETDLKYGFYHFYRPQFSAVTQANHFINAIKDFPSTLKPVLDVETTEGLGKKELSDSIKAFISIVEKELKTEMIIYTYSNFYTDNLNLRFDSEQLIWIANYNSDFPIEQETYAQIWQFTDKGTVDGIGAKVDLNIAKKGSWDKIQWE